MIKLYPDSIRRINRAKSPIAHLVGGVHSQYMSSDASLFRHHTLACVIALLFNTCILLCPSIRTTYSNSSLPAKILALKMLNSSTKWIYKKPKASKPQGGSLLNSISFVALDSIEWQYLLWFYETLICVYVQRKEERSGQADQKCKLTCSHFITQFLRITRQCVNWHLHCTCP